MGAGASQGFVEAADDKEMEMPDAPGHLKALASRQAQADGASEAIICQGLVALEPCVQRRLNRRISKPLDLACLRAFKKEMEVSWVKINERRKKLIKILDKLF